MAQFVTLSPHKHERLSLISLDPRMQWHTCKSSARMQRQEDHWGLWGSPSGCIKQTRGSVQNPSKKLRGGRGSLQWASGLHIPPHTYTCQRYLRDFWIIFCNFKVLISYFLFSQICFLLYIFFSWFHKSVIPHSTKMGTNKNKSHREELAGRGSLITLY